MIAGRVGGPIESIERDVNSEYYNNYLDFKKSLRDLDSHIGLIKRHRIFDKMYRQILKDIGDSNKTSEYTYLLSVEDFELTLLDLGLIDDVCVSYKREYSNMVAYNKVMGRINKRLNIKGFMFLDMKGPVGHYLIKKKN